MMTEDQKFAEFVGKIVPETRCSDGSGSIGELDTSIYGVKKDLDRTSEGL